MIATKKKKLAECGLTWLWVLASWLPFSATAQPVIAKAHEVVTCKFVADIQADSGYGKNTDWRVIAHHAVLVKAHELEATHVVVVQLQAVGAFNGVVTAKAFRCDA